MDRITIKMACGHKQEVEFTHPDELDKLEQSGKCFDCMCNVIDNDDKTSVYRLSRDQMAETPYHKYWRDDYNCD